MQLYPAPCPCWHPGILAVPVLSLEDSRQSPSPSIPLHLILSHPISSYVTPSSAVLLTSLLQPFGDSPGSAWESQALGFFPGCGTVPCVS